MSDPCNPAPVLRLVKGAPPFPDESALVAGVREGALGASRAVWDRYAAVVYGLARRALGPEHDVEDLVQETFLNLFRALGSLRDPTLLRSFVISIAMNTIRLELRKRKLRAIVRLTASGVVPEARSASDPSARTALVRFYRILDGLGAEERACFSLRRIEGLELADIGLALGLSVATVKRRLERATERVGKRVRKDPFLLDYLVSHHVLAREPAADV